jgi:hypothetical protein
MTAFCERVVILTWCCHKWNGQHWTAGCIRHFEVHFISTCLRFHFFYSEKRVLWKFRVAGLAPWMSCEWKHENFFRVIYSLRPSVSRQVQVKKNMLTCFLFDKLSVDSFFSCLVSMLGFLFSWSWSAELSGKGGGTFIARDGATITNTLE